MTILTGSDPERAAGRARLLFLRLKEDVRDYGSSRTWRVTPFQGWDTFPGPLPGALSRADESLRLRRRLITDNRRLITDNRRLITDNRRPMTDD